MGNRIQRIVMVIVLLLALPLLVSAQDRPQGKRLFKEPKPPVHEVGPLDAPVKLKVVNDFRLKNNLSKAKKVPPSTVTLTPSAPSDRDSNYFAVYGYYSAKPGTNWIALKYLSENQSQGVILNFAVTQGTTYLVDVKVDETDTWFYSIVQNGPFNNGTMTATNGHLLIPFIATGSSVAIEVSPRPPSPGYPDAAMWRPLTNNFFLSGEIAEFP